jgi:glycosyltransferase involved in cell wall biosynthesis
MQKISAIIITYNEERNVERCLRSVQWVDEIIVVDAFSTDKTVEICRRLNVKVLQRRWEGLVEQKRFALDSASHSWLLFLNAEEEVPLDLRKEIEDVVLSQTDIAGYEIPQMSCFLGRWMKYGGCYPAYDICLFQKPSSSIHQRPAHGAIEVKGTIGRLKSPLHHYIGNSIAQYLAKLNDTTSLDVMAKRTETTQHLVRWYTIIITPLVVFIRMFFVMKGFYDGFHGLILAAYCSFTRFVSCAKTWEYQSATEGRQALPPITSDVLNSINNFN